MNAKLPPYKIFLIAFLLASFVFPMSVKAAFASSWRWSPQVAFKLPAYNTVIAFDDWLYLDSFVWDGWNASAITFINIQLGEVNVPTLTLSVKNANITITQLLDNKQFRAELTGPSGAIAVLTVYNSLYTQMPTSVTIGTQTLTVPASTKTDFDKLHANGWYYDFTTKTVYIKAELHSLTPIRIDYYGLPTPEPPPTPPPVTPAPPPTTYGLVVAVTSMGRPVPDLKVEVYSDSTLVASGATNQQGIYSVSLPPGTYRVVVYLDKEKITKTVDLNEPKTLTITVPAAPAIEITRFIELAAILTILLILLTAVANYIRKR